MNLASSKMSSYSSAIAVLRELFEKAIFSENCSKLFFETLPKISNFISGNLDNSQNSPLYKLSFILSVFSKLESLMETQFWRNHLFKVGYENNFVIIGRNILFCAHSLPALIDQSEYAAALLEFPSSGFPLLLAELPFFLKANLLDKYDTMKEKASKAAAAADADGAKHEFVFEKYIPIFRRNWDEVPKEHLPALEEGMRLRNEILHGSASKTTLTEDQQNLVKSYVEFTKFCEFEAYGK
jgi:hypothetical protein